MDVYIHKLVKLNAKCMHAQARQSDRSVVSVLVCQSVIKTLQTLNVFEGITSCHHGSMSIILIHH